MVAAADLVISTPEVAVRVTVGELGTLLGAEYVEAVPLALSVGETLPQAGAQAFPLWVSSQETQA